MVEAGKLKVHIGQVFGLEDIAPRINGGDWVLLLYIYIYIYLHIYI